MTDLKRAAFVAFLLTVLQFEATGPPAAQKAGADHDAIILEEELSVEIRSVTDAREKYRRRVQVLTPNGVEEYEDAVTFYSPGVTVLSLRGSVTLPSGKILNADRKATVDGPSVASFELYTDSRYKSMRLPGVVPGAIIEYSHERAFQNLFYLTDDFLLQEDVPVKKKTLTLTASSAVPVRFSSIGPPAEYSTSTGPAGVTHRWSVKDVAGFRSEPGAPPNADLLPRVTFRPTIFDWAGHHVRADSWDGIAVFYSALAERRMLPGPDVIHAAEQTIAGSREPSEKVRRLFEFVQDKVRYVAIELGIGGWQPHANGDVMRYRYGDCKDKATLLIAMLRAVGLQGWPVLIRTRDAGLLDPKVPALAFNHAIVVVPAGDSYLFMDPTSTSTGFGDLPWQDQGASALIVKPDGTGEFLTTPLHPPDRNARRFDVTARVGLSGNLDGTFVMRAQGQRRAGLASLSESEPSDQRAEIAGLLAEFIAGAQVKDYRIEQSTDAPDETRITIDFTVAGFVTRAGSIEVIRPHLIRFSGTGSAASDSSRRHPVFYRYLHSDIVESRLYLPPGRTLRKLPEELKAEGPGISAATRYELAKDQGRNLISMRHAVSVTRREILPSDFPDYRTFLSALEQDRSRAVTLIQEP